MKKPKSLCALLMVVSLFISLSTPCFAVANNVVATNPAIASSEAELIQQMRALGFERNEINAILQLEEERIQKMSSRFTTYVFPSNPEEGNEHYETFDIHLSTINLTVAGIAGALIKGGVGAAIALVLAQAIMNEITEDSNYEAIRVTICYRHGITNDGYPGWNYGPITWELI